LPFGSSNGGSVGCPGLIGGSSVGSIPIRPSSARHDRPSHAPEIASQSNPFG
jgi:hypothetical protein